MTTAPGLYVHLPFCAKLCPYCDFYVLTGNADRRRDFLHALAAEIELCRRRPWPTFVGEQPRGPFDTLYIGGGTPSLMAPEQLWTLRQHLETCLPMAEDSWLGLEANPEDVTAENLQAWRQIGFQFLSLGIQTFDERGLRFLGRLHHPQDCRRSAMLAREVGLTTLSFDLIYGLPGQTEESWRADLLAALELRPDHLSCYQLTVETGTPFGFRRDRGELTELTKERQADLFFLTHELLADHGFEAYEVSNFASAPRHRSVHNRKYWRHTPYLGLGPSAHSFAGRQRWWNARKIKPYGSRIHQGERPILEHESLTPSQLLLEKIMLGLRTPLGVDLDELGGSLGSDLWEINRSLIDELAATGLLGVEERRLRPSLAGLAVAEAMACRFELPEIPVP